VPEVVWREKNEIEIEKVNVNETDGILKSSLLSFIL
jgi:hypothetical protein